VNDALVVALAVVVAEGPTELLLHGAAYLGAAAEEGVSLENADNFDPKANSGGRR